MRRIEKTKIRSRRVYFPAILLIALPVFVLSVCTLMTSIEKLVDDTSCLETGCHGNKHPSTRHERKGEYLFVNVMSLPVITWGKSKSRIRATQNLGSPLRPADNNGHKPTGFTHHPKPRSRHRVGFKDGSTHVEFKVGATPNIGLKLRSTSKLGLEDVSTKNQESTNILKQKVGPNQDMQTNFPLSQHRENMKTSRRTTRDIKDESSAKPTGLFIPVDNGTMFLYSAFLDSTESPPSVKVVAMVTASRPTSFSVTCVFGLTSGSRTNVTGSVDMVPEAKYGYKYRSAVITCPFTKKDKPITISISVEKNSVPSNALHVTFPTNEKPSSITRCYPVLHSSINDVTLLVQSVEASRVFGADRFVFYNQSIGPDVDVLLRHYVKHTDMVTVLEWTLPVDVKDVHYWGQLLTLHDCLYRHLHSTSHILFADLDEILVPKQHKDWVSLMKHFTSRRRDGCSAWIFQHAFFPTFQTHLSIGNQKDDAKILEKMLISTIRKSKVTSSNLHSSSNVTNHQVISNQTSDSNNEELKLQMSHLPFLKHTLHSRVQSMHDRSKYIVDPKRVKILGIHEVKAFKTLGYCYVNDKMALIHHYRQSWSNDMSPPWSHDRAISNFSASILFNVKNRLLEILRSTE